MTRHVAFDGFVIRASQNNCSSSTLDLVAAISVTLHQCYILRKMSRARSGGSRRSRLEQALVCVLSFSVLDRLKWKITSSVAATPARICIPNLHADAWTALRSIDLVGVSQDVASEDHAEFLADETEDEPNSSGTRIVLLASQLSSIPAGSTHKLSVPAKLIVGLCVPAKQSSLPAPLRYPRTRRVVHLIYDLVLFRGWLRYPTFGHREGGGRDRSQEEFSVSCSTSRYETGHWEHRGWRIAGKNREEDRERKRERLIAKNMRANKFVRPHERLSIAAFVRPAMMDH